MSINLEDNILLNIHTGEHYAKSWEDVTCLRVVLP
jgi:hypothetical protein